MPETETESSAATGTTLPDEFTPGTVKDKAGINTQPAEAVAGEYKSWDEFLESDGDFQDISGVGPKSAGALDALQGDLESVVTSEEATTDTAVDVDDEPEAHTEPSTDDGEVDTQSEQSVETVQDDKSSDEDSNGAASDSSEENEEDDEVHERIESLKVPRTLEAEFTAEILKAFIHSLTVIQEEFRLRVTEDGFEATGVDAANVMMADNQLGKGAANAWDASPGVIGLDVERLWSVLKMAGKKDTVQLSFDAQTKKLTVTVDGLEYTLGTYQAESIRQPPEIPEDLDMTTEASLSPDHLGQAFDAVDMVSDHVTFESEQPDGLAITADGDTDSVSYEADDLQSITPGDDSAIYALEYLERLPTTLRKFKGDQDPEHINIRMGSNMPIQMEFTFADGDGSIFYMLAPRIKNQ